MADIISYRDILKSVQQQFKDNYINSDKYKQEFDQLKAHSDGLNLTQTRDDGWLQYNRSKNRYKDILPYDRTRVQLPVISNIAGSDYINASHISGPEGYVNYIAAQGPLPSTVFDFWRMVWYNYVTVIVMVCKQMELGKVKCANYWGKAPGNIQAWGNFNVKFVSEKREQNYVVRSLVITCAEVSREVYLYQYLDWPDRDVPEDGEPLNKMLALAREKCPAKTNSNSPGSPIVIHCSAGCGRTGTVLAMDYIDILIRQQRLDREFSLFDLVKCMRTERVAICQTKQQYGFVYYTAIQLLESAIETLDMRSEATSDSIYENVPLSPTLKETVNPFDKLPAKSLKPQMSTEKDPKPEKPPKPDKPRSKPGSPITARYTTKPESCNSNLLGSSAAAEPLYASINQDTRTAKLIDIDDHPSTNDEPPPLPTSPAFGTRPGTVHMDHSTPPPITTPAPPLTSLPRSPVLNRPAPPLSSTTPARVTAAPLNLQTGLGATPATQGHLYEDNVITHSEAGPTRGQHEAVAIDNELGSHIVGTEQSKLTVGHSARFDDDNYSELSIPHSVDTDSLSHIAPSSGDDVDEEDDDLYETFDKGSKSKEQKPDPSSNKKFSLGGKKIKTKSFGFKGLLANISDSAHEASQNLKSKSNNVTSNLSRSFASNTPNSSVYQDLPEMKYVSEFGKRTESPMGPREMPEHWIKI